MTGSRWKILEGWKYQLYVRSNFSADADPNLYSRIVDLLKEEGVPSSLIRKQSGPYQFLDFYASPDDPLNPKLVIITICSMKNQDDSWNLSFVREVPFKNVKRALE